MVLRMSPDFLEVSLPGDAYPPEPPQNLIFSIGDDQPSWSWSFGETYDVDPLRTIVTLRYGTEETIESITGVTFQYPQNLTKSDTFVPCVAVQTVTQGGTSERTEFVCAFCQPGAALVDDNVCQDCPTGKYATFDQGCLSCTPGRYAAEEGSTECSFCGANQYQPFFEATECFNCPANSIRYFDDFGLSALESTNSLKNCTCLPNSYPRLAGFTGVDCRKCPNAGSCNGGIAEPEPKKNFWGVGPRKFGSDARVEFYGCLAKGRCKGKFHCSRSFRGRLCNAVDTGEAFLFAGERYGCPRHHYARYALVAGLILMVFAAWSLLNIFLAGEFEVFDVGLLGLQIVALIYSGIDVDWPNAIRRAVDAPLAFLLFDVNLATPNCVYVDHSVDPLKKNFFLKIILVS